MSLPSLGSVLGLLLAARPRELEIAISKFDRNPQGSLSKALESLLQHLNRGLSKGTIDHISVPLLENVVKSPKNAIALIRWLFQEAGAALSTSLVQILSSSHFGSNIKYGLCIVIRELLETRLPEEKASIIIPTFATCLATLAELAKNSSVSDEGKKRPTHLAVAAAECALTMSGMLAANQEPGWSSILWQHLDSLVALVCELCDWKKQTHVLHARGLWQIKKILEDLQVLAQEEREHSAGILVLQLCWNKYVKLIALRGVKEASNTEIRELVSALQHFSDKGSRKMRCHILACLALILGDMEQKMLCESLEISGELFQLLLSQLSKRESAIVEISAEIIEDVFIQKAASTIGDVGQVLLNLFDNQTVMNDAVCRLLAQYLSRHPPSNVQSLFTYLDSKGDLKRRNAVKVILQLLLMFQETFTHDSSLLEIVGTELLKRLGDKDIVDQKPTAAFLRQLDPADVLPKLIQHVNASDGKIGSRALISLFQDHPDQYKAVHVFLDSLQSMSSSLKQLRSADLDPVMRVVPSWAGSVKDWNQLLPSIMDKMFSEPSSAVFPRFMSEISNQLAEMPDTVFQRVLHAMEENEANYLLEDKTEMAKRLFSKLSPLLVLKVLPSRAYNLIDCYHLYGCGSISTLLVKWMCDPSEYPDVRKLSAELTGRFLPEAMLGLIMEHFQAAVTNRNTVTIRTCIYAICNSLMIRGAQALHEVGQARIILAKILLWPTSAEEVQKVQDGCIDCLAIMIRAELSEGTDTQEQVLGEVLACLTDGDSSVISFAATTIDTLSLQATTRFRLFMANVLISSSSKIAESSQQLFVVRVFPVLMGLLEVEKEPLMRAACIQVLYNAVHNLKSADLGTYAKALLDISLTAVKSPDQEKVLGFKLFASLLVNETVLRELETSHLDVQQILSSIRDET